MSALLEARAVGKRIGAQSILRDVSFSVSAGEFVALTGRSGAGKSTLLAIVSSLEPAFDGSVTLAGVGLSGLSERRRALLRRRELGFVLQIPRLLSGLSVWDNLTAPAWVAGVSLDRARAQSLLERVGLGEFVARTAGGLSGGERQRLTLARALLLRPRLLFCDEPTGNLDQTTAAPIIALLETLRREEGLALVVATHDQALAAQANQRLHLERGALA